MREADQGQASPRCFLLESSVLLDLAWRAVEAPAVGLDHEPQARPVEVDSEAPDALLGRGAGDCRAAYQPEELALELGVGGLERLALQVVAQPGALPAGLARCFQQLPGVDQVELVGLVDRGIEAPRGPAGAQVDQGLRRRRSWDALVRCGVQLGCLVLHDAVAGATGDQ